VGKRERVGNREEFDGNLLFSHSLDPAFEAYPSTGRGNAVEEEAFLPPSLSAEEQLKQVLRRSAFSSEVLLRATYANVLTEQNPLSRKGRRLSNEKPHGFAKFL